MVASRSGLNLKITRGALILVVLSVGTSLVYLMTSLPSRPGLLAAIVAKPSAVWHAGKVWTLVTSAFLEDRFVSLLFQGFILWSFVPILERFWGTPRFLRFAALTIVAGTVAGTLGGLATGNDLEINGLDNFIYASIVAFGVVHARQPVKFFGAIPLTGRQLMYGILGVITLLVLLERRWETGAGYAGAIAVAFVVTSPTLHPALAWRRWRLGGKRSHLKVVRAEPKKWLN